jgi:uncharacterized membrane-anchored protein YhcB (DUF1043 family)
LDWDWDALRGFALRIPSGYLASTEFFEKEAELLSTAGLEDHEVALLAGLLVATVVPETRPQDLPNAETVRKGIRNRATSLEVPKQDASKRAASSAILVAPCLRHHQNLETHPVRGVGLSAGEFQVNPEEFSRYTDG